MLDRAFSASHYAITFANVGIFKFVLYFYQSSYDKTQFLGLIVQQKVIWQTVFTYRNILLSPNLSS